MNLEQYFRHCYDFNLPWRPNNCIDHAVRHDIRDAKVHFYIHPAGISGLTVDFTVEGNQLTTIWNSLAAPVPCLTPPKGWICTRARGHEGPCAAIPVGGEAAEQIARFKAAIQELLSEKA